MSPRANDEFRRAMTERAEQQARREEAAEERLADMRATIEHLRREREARLAEFHALTHPKATPPPPAERPMVEAVAAAEPGPESVAPTSDATDAAAVVTAAPTPPPEVTPESEPAVAEEPADGPEGDTPAGVDGIAADDEPEPEPEPLAGPDAVALPFVAHGVERDEISLATPATVAPPVSVALDAPEPLEWSADDPAADLATDSDEDAAPEEPPLLGDIVIPQRPSEPPPEPAGAPADAARFTAGAAASWRPWAGAGLALVIAIGGYAAWTTSRPAIAPAGNPAPEVPRASVPTAPVPSPAAAQTRPAAAPATPPRARPTSPAAATRSAGLRVVLRASRPVWVRATVDGAVTVNRTVPVGGEVTLSATDAVEVRVGDAGAVRITVNGEDRGLAGRSGQVITWRYVAEPAPPRR